MGGDRKKRDKASARRTLACLERMDELLKTSVQVTRCEVLEQQCLWNELDLRSEMDTAGSLLDKISNAIMEMESDTLYGRTLPKVVDDENP